MVATVFYRVYFMPMTMVPTGVSNIMGNTDHALLFENITLNLSSAIVLGQPTYSSTPVSPVAALLLLSFFYLAAIAVIITTLLGIVKTYKKAGEIGWTALVPFYNIVILLSIVGRPRWWAVLFIVPALVYLFAYCMCLILPIGDQGVYWLLLVGSAFLELCLSTVVCIDLARCFRRSGLFGLGLVVTPFIHWPMLGFGRDTYFGPSIRS